MKIMITSKNDNKIVYGSKNPEEFETHYMIIE